MPDHLLHELAEDAPPARPGFADDILHAARQRRRRRASALGAAAAAVLVAVGVPVAINLARGNDPTSPPLASGNSTPAPTSRSTDAVSVIATDTAIYPEAVRYASTHHDPTTKPTRVLVVDAVCASAATGGVTDCTGTLRPDIRQAIVRAVPDASFVRTPPRFTPKDPIDSGRLYVLLAPIQPGERSATVWVEQVCGFDCVRGDQLTFSRDGARWVFTGIRGSYVS